MSTQSQDEGLIILDETTEVKEVNNEEEKQDFELDFSGFSEEESKQEDEAFDKKEESYGDLEINFDSEELSQEEVIEDVEIIEKETFTEESNALEIAPQETSDIVEPLTQAIISYKEIQKSLEKKRTNYVNDRSDIESQIKELEARKANLNATISETDAELNKVSINIASLDLMKGETNSKK